MKRTRSEMLLDVVLCLTWVGLCGRTIYKTPEDTLLAFVSYLGVVRQGAAALFFLLRDPPQAVSRRPSEWVIAIAGTFVVFLYDPGMVTAPRNVAVILFLVSLFALVLSIFATCNLGVSFGIVPANRSIKTGGFYRLVRHPLYGLYFVTDTARLLIGPTPWNLAVYLVFVVLTCRRAVNEEQLLLEDAAYQKYASAVRWRFVPGIA